MKSNVEEGSCWSRLLITDVFALQILVRQVALCRLWVTGGVLIETAACNLVPRFFWTFFFSQGGTWLKESLMKIKRKYSHRQNLLLVSVGLKKATWDTICSDPVWMICIGQDPPPKFPDVLMNALDTSQSTVKTGAVTALLWPNFERTYRAYEIIPKVFVWLYGFSFIRFVFLCCFLLSGRRHVRSELTGGQNCWNKSKF